MRDKTHYINMLDNNSNSTFGYTLAASAVYAAVYGYCDSYQHGTDEWKIIARRLKDGYGESLTADEVRAEMENEIFQPA